jgi:hypothetical protein
MSTPEHDDQGDEIYDSLNPIETIRKGLRKENKELLQLASCKPTEETTTRMRELEKTIYQYVVSSIFKIDYL